MTVKEKQNKVLSELDNHLKSEYENQYSGFEDDMGGRMYMSIKHPVYGNIEFEYHRSQMSILFVGYNNDPNVYEGRLMESNFQSFIDGVKNEIFAS